MKKLIYKILTPTLLMFALANSANAIEGHYSVADVDIYIKKVMSAGPTPSENLFGMVLFQNGKSGALYKLEYQGDRLNWIPIYVQTLTKYDYLLSADPSYTPVYSSTYNGDILDLMPTNTGMRLGCNHQFLARRTGNSTWQPLTGIDGSYGYQPENMTISEGADYWSLSGVLKFPNLRLAGNQQWHERKVSGWFALEKAFAGIGMMRPMGYVRERSDELIMGQEVVALATVLGHSPTRPSRLLFFENRKGISCAMRIKDFRL